MRRWLYLVAIISGLTYLYIPPVDPDLGWHLLGGRWITEHHAVPSQDFINTFNPYWLDYHWLGQVVLYQIYSEGSYRRLAVFIAILISYLLTVCADIILLNRAARRSLFTSFAFLVFAASLLHQAVQIRPQMISLTIVAVALRRLLQKKTAWEMPFLFALSVLAANIHVYWILIPFLWLVYRCLPRLRSSGGKGALAAWGGFFLLCAAGFVSPYGLVIEQFDAPQVLKNYALIYEYLDVPATLRRTVGELRPTLKTSFYASCFLLGAIVLLARYVRLDRARARLENFSLGATSTYLALKSLKFCAVFSVLSLPLLLDTLAARLNRAWRVIKLDGAPLSRQAALLLVLTLLWRWSIFVGPALKPEDKYPLKACAQIPSLGIKPAPGRDHVRVLTHFDIGGWCRFAAYEADPGFDLRVTTDNRTQSVPEEHYKESLELFNMRNDWLKTLQRWDPDVAVVSTALPLAHFMLLAKDQWSLKMEDSAHALFVRIRKS